MSDFYKELELNNLKKSNVSLSGRVNHLELRIKKALDIYTRNNLNNDDKIKKMAHELQGIVENVN